MAFVFRSEKPLHLVKPSPSVGPGTFCLIKDLTTFKSNDKIKYQKLMFLSAVWSPKQNKMPMLLLLLWGRGHIISMSSRADRKLSYRVRLKISKFYRFQGLIQYLSLELFDLAKLNRSLSHQDLDNSKFEVT